MEDGSKKGSAPKPRRTTVKGSSQARLKIPVQAMQLQTQQAIRLVGDPKGVDQKRGGISLYNFGRQTTEVWRAAENDDPYADWTLIRIEESLESTSSLIREKTKEFRSRLTGAVTGMAEAEPVQIPLAFSNPYGYQGAWLLLDLDELLRTILTVRYYGWMGREATRQATQDGCRAVRSAFGSAYGWRGTGVSRADFQSNTPLAERTRIVLGEVPPDVLNGERRARNAPNIRRGTGEKKNDEEV